MTIPTIVLNINHDLIGENFKLLCKTSTNNIFLAMFSCDIFTKYTMLSNQTMYTVHYLTPFNTSQLSIFLAFSAASCTIHHKTDISRVYTYMIFVK